MAQAVSRLPLTEEAVFVLGSVYVVFLVDGVTLAQIFYEFFGFPLSI
jgi:hypothetical protein